MKRIMTKGGYLLLLFILFAVAGCKKPNASFTASSTNVKVGEEVKFTNTTTDNEKGPYFWDFGDGTSSNLKDPSHAYNKPGTYTVTMRASKRNNANPSDAPELAITVTGPDAPLAKFTAPDSSNVSAVVSFANTSTNADAFVWDFGDGTDFSKVKNPTHIYNRVGTFTVTLIAMSSTHDSISSASATITVKGVNGSPETFSKIIGTWKYDSLVTRITHNGVDTAGSPSRYYPLNTTHQYLQTGSIIATDFNNNMSIAGTFSVINSNSIYFSNLFYTITVLNSNTFRITRTIKTPDFFIPPTSFVLREQITSYYYSK